MKFKRVREESARFSQAQLWHERCAHVNIDYIRKTVKNGAIRGIKEENLEGVFFCEGCAYGKACRLPDQTVEAKRNANVGVMFHVDLAGPMPVKSLGGASYMLLIKDEATSFTTVYFLKEKSQTASVIVDYVNFMETQTGSKVKTVKSDNGTEFVNSMLKNFFKEKGIVHERSAPYTPQSNGKIERHIRTIKDYARSMLNRFQSPQFLWNEAVAAAVYVWNRMLNKTCDSVTLFEQVFQRTPDLSHLRVFGCVASAHINKQFRNTFEAKSPRCILVGYSGVSQNYRLYDPARRTIVEARNITFLEDLPEMLNKVKFQESESVQNINKVLTDTDNSAKSENTESIDSSSDEAVPSSSSDHTNSGSMNTSNEKVVLEFSIPKGKVVTEVNQNEPTKVKLSQLHKLRDRLNLKSPDRYKSYNTREMSDPLTFKEAVGSPNKDDWIAALEDEIDSLQEQETWDLVEKPNQCKVLSNRWVFKTKLKSDGSVD